MACAGFVTEIERDYIHFPGTDDRYEAFVRAAKESNQKDLEGLCMDVAGEHETQGFVNGFRFGVRLMLESLGPWSLAHETGKKGGGRHEA